MPAKKAKTPTEDHQVQETQTQTTPAPVSDDVNQRLARIEAAIEKMAAGPAPRVPSPKIMTTRGRAKKGANKTGQKDRRSISMDPDLGRHNLDTSQSESSGIAAAEPRQRKDVNKNARADVTPTPQAQQSRRNVLDPVVPQPGDPLAGINKTKLWACLRAPQKLLTVLLLRIWACPIWC